MPGGTITTFEMAQLRKAVEEKFSAAVRFHDSCGGQSFSLDKSSAEIIDFITAFFAERNIAIKFSENGLHFYTIRN